MRVVVSGASGYVGKLVSTHLEAKGYEVIPISRKHYKWHIHDFKEILRGADVFIHLAGAPIFKRWTKKYKKQLYKSRIGTTEQIVSAFKLLKDRPKTFISVSAVGIYNTNDAQHSEKSTDLGSDFLATLVKDWEQALAKVDELVDVRHTVFRLGVVLGKKSKAYNKMATPIKMGIGGRVAKGTQGFSVVHEQDLIAAFDHAISEPIMKGTYNLSMPVKINNKDFTKKLAKALKRPSFMIIPGFMLRLLYGQSSVILTKGQHAYPEALLKSGFKFKFDTVDKLIAKLTEKKKASKQ